MLEFSAGCTTVNVTPLDVPPPGVGVKTVIDGEAPFTISDARI